MTLFLDHNQRMNLIAVLGAWDVKGRDLHAVWHLQDSLDLDAKEKEILECQEDNVNGQQIRRWNATKTVPVRSFEITDADVTRIQSALDEFPQMRASRDRAWVEPIYAQLPNSDKEKS